MPIAGFNLGKYSRVDGAGGQDCGGSLRHLGRGAHFPARHDRGAGFAATSCRPSRELTPTDEITVNTPPPSPARNAQAVADTSARAVDFFARRFGPYPYTSLALTQMPGDVSQGWPSLIFLSSFSFLTPEEKIAFAYESGGKDPER